MILTQSGVNACVVYLKGVEDALFAVDEGALERCVFHAHVLVSRAGSARAQSHGTPATDLYPAAPSARSDGTPANGSYDTPSQRHADEPASEGFIALMRQIGVM